jgi:hypothetical protein
VFRTPVNNPLYVQQINPADRLNSVADFIVGNIRENSTPKKAAFVTAKAQRLLLQKKNRDTSAVPRQSRGFT